MIHPSMEEFLSFVSAKRPDESYIFDNPDACACGQFAEKIGVLDWLDDPRDRPFWNAANRLAGEGAYNFGRLASSVQEYIADEAEETRP